MEQGKLQLLELNTIIITTGYSIYSKLKNIFNNHIYEQRLELSERKLVKWGCTCVFGSIYRFSQKYQEIDKKCRHALFIIDLLNYLGYLENEPKAEGREQKEDIKPN